MQKESKEEKTLKAILRKDGDKMGLGRVSSDFDRSSESSFVWVLPLSATK